MPRRVPNQFHLHLSDRFDLKKCVAHAQTNAFVHRAAGCGEGHFYEDFCAMHTDVVKESEIDDVATKLRVNDLAQRFKECRYADWMGAHAGLGGMADGMANRVSLGRNKWVRIVPTFTPRVATLSASK